MADFSALLDRNFKGDALKSQAPIRLTLKEVKAAEVGMDKEVKPVAYFLEDPRGVVLNTTKYTLLADANKSREADNWTGTVVELFFEEVKYKGKPVGSVGMKIITPAKK